MRNCPLCSGEGGRCMGEILTKRMENENSLGGIIISFTKNDLEAYICLPPGGSGYTLSLLKSRLKDAGVTFGVNEDALRELLEKDQRNVPVKVAEGIPPIQGKDGWYEFMFSTEQSDKPKILEDGSVDYSRYGDIPSIEEGAVVAVYHPALESKDGMNVFGDFLVATKGKNMARLSGRGFTVQEDGCTYIAKYGGKVTYSDGRMIIDAELVIQEDISNTTGDITYRNDIHVRGNIQAGMEVVSEKGSIIVDGYVESATLRAGKNVVLKNGMQGNGRGTIIAGGDVSGKFFEQCTIDASGNVNANAIMNSIISAGEDIVVSGKFGSIVGGDLKAQRQIQATMIGNTAEVDTKITAGVAGDLFAMLNQCEQQINKMEQEYYKVTQGLERIEKMLEAAQNEELQQKKILLMRSKIEKDSAINEAENRKEELVLLMEKAGQAKVTITKLVYPGTVIMINGVKTNVKEPQNHVEFARRGHGIIVYHIEEG